MADEIRYVVTGGLGEGGLRELHQFLTSKGWYTVIQYDGGGKAPYARTGGLNPAALAEFEAWLKARGWYYTVEA
ncbi:hypothetical protein [Ectobacillus ponti]|uniref:Uncharacterized protein n=1 Tax=Ectobacillus ponti TaxID=2961894 RepID=A0AA42BQ29_9BACI|nr:hypothetical protein [Ectobacillus ponti]MCP8968981.1 hypothetical protein [Ectobacillus ponti]